MAHMYLTGPPAPRRVSRLASGASLDYGELERGREVHGEFIEAHGNPILLVRTDLELLEDRIEPAALLFAIETVKGGLPEAGAIGLAASAGAGIENLQGGLTIARWPCHGRPFATTGEKILDEASLFARAFAVSAPCGLRLPGSILLFHTPWPPAAFGQIRLPRQNPGGGGGIRGCESAIRKET